VSITWMTPLVAITSAVTTVASLILTPLVVSIARVGPATVVASFRPATASEVTLPATTW
jgi:hypothetical protein